MYSSIQQGSGGIEILLCLVLGNPVYDVVGIETADHQDRGRNARRRVCQAW